MENEFKHRAICIKSSDIGEADRNIVLLSEDEGKIKARIKGVKKAKAKLSYASFPFCFGEYLWVRRGDFCTITNCNFIDNFSPMLADMNKYYAGCGVLEIVNLLTKENQESNNIFILLLKSLNVLAYKQNVNIFTVLTKFIVDVLSFSGYGINFFADNNNATTLYFDFESGTLCSKKSVSAYLLSDKDSEILINLCTKDFSTFNFEASTSKNVLKMLIEFFEYRTEDKISILKQFC